MFDEKPKLSEPFSKMAERIDHNASEAFGGAFVIVPPAGAGTMIETLLLTQSGDPANFWLVLQSHVNKVLADLQAPPNPYGRR